MPRRIWVASISLGYDSAAPGDVDENVARILRGIEQAAAYQPDLIVLPECFHAAGLSDRPAHEVAVSLEHRLVRRIVEQARRLQSMLVCPVYEARDGRVYNTALCFDRQGNLVGRYDKIHPTESELQNGLTPGREDQPVWQTPLGCIGCRLCFDVNWPEGWHRLAEAGAELIVWPSAYAGGRVLAAMALVTQTFVLSATWPRACRLFDASGDLLAANGRADDVLVAEIDLERTLFHLDYQQAKLRELQRRYGRAVRVDVHHEEGWFALQSSGDAPSVPDLIEEFGLVPLRAYLGRAGAAQDAARPSS